MFPKTYHDSNREDRAYTDDMWSWLREQPQDAWLLFVRQANWGLSGDLFKRMVDDPRCDRAVAAYLFWTEQPAYEVENPSRFWPESLIGKIVANAQRGFYRDAQLYLSQYELVIWAQDYIGSLRKMGGRAPFSLPRMLCGPFEGRDAQLPAAYDAETERALTEWFDEMNGSLPRSEKEHWLQEKQSDNLWVMDWHRLPKANTLTQKTSLDDATFVEALFGKHAAYTVAIADMHSGKQPPFKDDRKRIFGLFFVLVSASFLCVRALQEIMKT